MRKLVTVLAALALLTVIVGAANAGVTTYEDLYTGTNEGCTLSIVRYLTDSSDQWTWEFNVSLSDDAGSDAVIHEFSVGLIDSSIVSHISGLGSSVGTAEGHYDVESVYWTFDKTSSGEDTGIYPGGSAKFWFTTDLDSVSVALHRAVDGEYYASFDPAASPAPTPEPGTIAMLATGVTGLLGAAIRKRK